MKTLTQMKVHFRFFFLILTFTTSLHAQSSWAEQDYPHKEQLLNDVVFLNRNEGWIVGDKGLIMHTADGGSTWVEQISGVTSNLVSISLVNDSTAWIVGDSGILLHTSDHGLSWIKKSTAETQNFRSVCFNSSAGWVAGSNGILKTTDSGNTWKKVDDHQTACVFSLDSLKAWAVQEGVIKRTINGGKTWKYYYPNTQTLYYFCRGPIRSGEPNQVCSYPTILFNFTSIHFTSPMNGWVTGYIDVYKSVTSRFPHDGVAIVTYESFGILYRTDDGGVTWNAVLGPIVNRPILTDVFFVNEMTGWVSGKNIIHTKDRGESMLVQEHSLGQELKVENIFFVDSVGWVVGSVLKNGNLSGIILKTQNYGGDGIEIPTAPNAPTNLNASTDTESESVELSWTDNSEDEEKFVIVREGLHTPTDGIIGDTVASISSFKDFSIEPDVGYHYRVFAVNAGGWSTFSNFTYVLTPLELVNRAYFPNPTRNFLNVKLRYGVQAEATIVNSFGGILKKISYGSPNSILDNNLGNILKIDVSDFLDGVYFLKITTVDGEVSIKKFVKSSSQ